MTDQPVVKKRRKKAEIVAEKAECAKVAAEATCAKMTAEKKPRKKKEMPVTATWPFPTGTEDKAKLAANEPTFVVEPVAEAVQVVEAPVQVVEAPYTKPTPVTAADYGTVTEAPPELPKSWWQKFKEALRF